MKGRYVQIFPRSRILHSKTYITNERLLTLTNREMEVVKWICEGLSSKEIAGKLYNSTHTILRHRKNILQKTGAANLTEVVAFAIRNHII